MILACRVLRSSLGQESCRSQHMDGFFGTYSQTRRIALDQVFLLSG